MRFEYGVDRIRLRFDLVLESTTRTHELPSKHMEKLLCASNL